MPSYSFFPWMGGKSNLAKKICQLLPEHQSYVYFILKTSFGGMGGTNHRTFGYGSTGKAKFSRSVFSAIRRCHKRLDGVFIENLDFSECIKRYDRPSTLFYCDPPYWQTKGYKSPFTWDHHTQLASILKNIKGKFLLSINDHKDIRKLYKGCKVKKLDVKYSVSRVKTKKARERSELLIANYKP